MSNILPYFLNSSIPLDFTKLFTNISADDLIYFILSSITKLFGNNNCFTLSSVSKKITKINIINTTNSIICII